VLARQLDHVGVGRLPGPVIGSTRQGKNEVDRNERVAGIDESDVLDRNRPVAGVPLSNSLKFRKSNGSVRRASPSGVHSTIISQFPCRRWRFE
jgi:hypothetical protein